MKEERYPDLEAAIHARPDDEDAWAVYGDWLQSRRDPRGELIALSLALKQNPESRALEKRALLQLKKMGPGLMGAVKIQQKKFDGDKNLIMEEFLGVRTNLRLEWRYGFIHKIGMKFNIDQGYEEQLEIFTRIIRSGASRFLGSLNLEMYSQAENVKHSQRAFAKLNQTLLERGQHPGLREFNFNCYTGNNEAVNEYHDLTSALTLFPELHFLHLSGNVQFQSLFSKKIETLNLGPTLWKAEVGQGLALLDLPLLRKISIYLGSSHYNHPAPHGTIQALFRNNKLPGLRSLQLSAYTFETSDLEELFNSPFLGQLEELVLGSEILTNKNAGALLNKVELFAHLKKFSVAGMNIAPELKVKLLKAYGERLQFT